MKISTIWDRGLVELTTAIALTRFLSRTFKEKSIIVIMRESIHEKIKIVPFFKEKIVIPKPVIDYKLCNACNTCIEVCPTGALVSSGEHKPVLLDIRCISCMRCVSTCPRNAIKEGESLLGYILKGSWRGYEILLPLRKEDLSEELLVLLEDKAIKHVSNHNKHVFFIYPLLSGSTLQSILSLSDVAIVIREKLRMKSSVLKEDYTIYTTKGDPENDNEVKIANDTLIKIYSGLLEDAINDVEKALSENEYVKKLSSQLITHNY